MKRRPCKRCGRNRQERFFVSPKGRVCSTCRKRRTKHASRDVRLQETYNISQAEYDAMFKAQGGRCAICKGTRPGNLDVDHDHKHDGPVRDSVRGLTCRRCNRRLLPACLDRVDILENAIEYLTNWPSKRVLEDIA